MGFALNSPKTSILTLEPSQSRIRAPQAQACAHPHALCTEVPDEVANCGDLALAADFDLSLGVRVLGLGGLWFFGADTFGRWGPLVRRLSSSTAWVWKSFSLFPVLKEAPDHAQKVDGGFGSLCKELVSA